MSCSTEYAGIIVRAIEPMHNETLSSLLARHWFIAKCAAKSNEAGESGEALETWSRLWACWKLGGCGYAAEVECQLRALDARAGAASGAGAGASTSTDSGR